jgi:aryl-alcohol dehydrogenase-like predicted oxidoreductase
VTTDLLARVDGRYAWLQNSLSLLDQADEREVPPHVQATGLGYTPYSPLAGGWLTGKYVRDKPPPPGSPMDSRPGPYLDLRRDDVWRGLDRLRRWAADRDLTMATVAYAWVLSDGRVTAMLIGPRDPEQVRVAIDALELRLSGPDRSGLAGFFSDGHATPQCPRQDCC